MVHTSAACGLRSAVCGPLRCLRNASIARDYSLTKYASLHKAPTAIFPRTTQLMGSA